MDSFLKEVADRLMAEHPSDMDSVTVVFNNRRSALFMRHELLKMSSAPRFLPHMIGMDTLISELCGLEIVPNELLLFELYDIHRHQPDGKEKYATFEEFMSFGDMMLADFSEIDLYMVDAEKLFNNLHDIKAIGEWDIESGQLTPFQERYLQFYRSIFDYYTQLRQRLSNRDKAYSGMAYRHVAENIERLSAEREFGELWFVGFNALSTSESHIIQHYIKQSSGRLITDGDAYYFENPYQEAGHFLRQHKGDFPSIGGYADHFADGKKKITIVNCPENVLQTKYTGQLLAELFSKKCDGHQAEPDPIQNTALILGDETLLLPTLNSLPEDVPTANVNMGFPYGNTSIHALTLKLFSLHTRRNGGEFHHQDIVDLITDPVINQLVGGTNAYSRINTLMYQDHIVMADIDTVEALCREIGADLSPIGYLFSPTQPSADELLAMIRQLIQAIYASQTLATNRKENEAIACLLLIIDYLTDIQQQYHYIESLSVLQKVYLRIAQRRSLAFYGEPLEGLQILGMLETRNLDFRRVIMLSVGEGIIPSGKKFNSLIPYNLKVAFNLPTFHDKDAVYAYNFFRLLQRAEEVYLIYSSESNGIGKGEPSRFLLQVQRELAGQYPTTIELHEVVLSPTNQSSASDSTMTALKSERVMQRLHEMSKKGFSPSALNKYRGCPLKFYYENVLGIKESDQLSEDLEQNELGSSIHAALQQIYSRDADGLIRKETLEQALTEVDDILREVLDEQYRHGRSHLGRNWFMESVARTQITNFLHSEIKRLEQGESITVISLEKELRHSLTVETTVGATKVDIAGIADRIDLTDGVVRIIDYKSGRVEERELSVRESQPHWADVPDKWFQVMLYDWLYHHISTGKQPHIAGIYPLGHLRSELMTATWEKETLVSNQHMSTFEQMLCDMVSELMSPEVPFLSNPGCRLCKYCPFLKVC